MKAGKRIESTDELLSLIEEYDQLQERLCLIGERLTIDTATHEVWKEAILKWPEHKRLIAWNKRLDDETLRLLAKDEDPMIRRDIANKNTFPADLFEAFANDPDPSVRGTIASHKKAPSEILKRLTNDPEDWVSERAKDSLSKRVQ